MEKLLKHARKNFKKLFTRQFSPLKRLVIDMVTIVFNEQVKARNTHEMLKTIDDFVFSFGEIRESFMALCSNIQYEKRVMEMGQLFTKGDCTTLIKDTRFISGGLSSHVFFFMEK